jgi:hypothetical protein
MYWSQLIQFGIEFNLLYNPLNIINGKRNAGVSADAFLASWKMAPVINPKLFPTRDMEAKVATKLKQKY